MLTELTDIKNAERIRGWVLYDGSCAFCRGIEERWGESLRRRGLRLAPLQTPWVQRRLSARASDLSELLLLRPDGSVLGGADAIIALWKGIWWAWPVVALTYLPGLRPLLRRGYAFIAVRRHRLMDGTCALKTVPRLSPTALLPLILLVSGALALRRYVATWALMWLVASSMFYGCKWLTYWHRRDLARRFGLGRTLAWFFAWPGMNPRVFFAKPQKLPKRSILGPLVKIFVGIALIWIVARRLPAAWPLVRAWVAMAGIILILHMGCFDLLAAAWRRRGIDARPVIDRPLRTASVADFWSNRWNIPFRDLAHTYIARPLAPWGRVIAMCSVFIISGLIHELLISVPAHGGYGLPTLYFTIQVPAILIERRLPRWALRPWAYLFVAGLAPVGFHRVFVMNVVVPLMHALHAF